MTNKTQPTKASVKKFIESVEHAGRREDAFELLDLMKEASEYEPVMWGDSLIGFGQYHYKYESGREGEFFLTGFSPRKANMVIYIMPGFDIYKDDLAKLGKHKLGSSCLYVGRLANLDLKTLKKLVKSSVHEMKKRYPSN